MASASHVQISPYAHQPYFSTPIVLVQEPTGAEDHWNYDDDSRDDPIEEEQGQGVGHHGNKGGTGRTKITIEYIQERKRRQVTFAKRKAGLMKKAYELSTLTGTQILLLVVSETGLVYTFTTGKLQPLVTQSEGKNLIHACLNG